MSAAGRARGTAAAVGPCLVWLASALPFFVAEERLEGVSRAALAALPWIAWSALPRKVEPATERGGPSVRSSALAVPLELALLLPPLALGAWIDLAAGLERSSVITTAATSAVLVALLAAGARLAAGAPGTLRRHAIAWIVLVAGLPLLVAALELGGAPLFGPAPAWMAWLARASPIAWGIGALRTTGEPEHVAWGPFLVAIALLAIGTLGTRARNGSHAGAEAPA